VFVKPERSVIPWLKNYGGLSGSQRRSCRHSQCPTTVQGSRSYKLCGMVDLCPCVKLRQGTKHRIQAKLHKIEQDNNPHHLWHVCRHFYGDITLEIKFAFFSYEKDGELGVWIKYHHSSASGSSSVCPRITCPHIYVDTLVDTLSKCRDLHSENVVCMRCKDLQHCKDCSSIVSKFAKETNSTSAVNSYSFAVERRLDKKLWPEHTVFHFARQRQYDSIQRGSIWKLW